MTAERNYENGVSFSKEFWPESGTKIGASIPADLNDLWENFPDQASVFVAEAMIADPPTVIFDINTIAQIEVFFCDVGGDVLSIKESLADLIALYNPRLSDDLESDLAALEQLEAAIAKVKEVFKKTVAASQDK